MADHAPAGAATGRGWRAALALATALAGLYSVNVLYEKLIVDGGRTALMAFGGGLLPVHQFVVLLLMSACFAAAVLLHPGEGI